MKLDILSTAQNKEQKLIQQIIDAKQKLEKLQHHKKIEYGAMLIKHRLDQVQPSVLDTALSNLAKELLDVGG